MTGITFHKTIFYFVIISLLIGTIFGCKSKKTLIDTSKPLDIISVDSFNMILGSRKLDPQTISLKARVGYEDIYTSIGFRINLRMIKDSLIWMNVSKIGYEVSRVLIRPDSIFIVDRWNKSYLAERTEFLTRRYKVPLEYEDLQNLIYGNRLYPFTELAQLTILGDQYRILDKNESMISSHFYNGYNMHLINQEYMHARNDQRLFIEQGIYEKHDGYEFSMSRLIETFDELGNDLTLSISVQSVNFDEEVNIIFSIPERYERLQP